MAGRANALARRGEASPFQTDENSAIDIRHDSRCAHACAGALRHDPGRLVEMLLCPRDGWRAGLRQRRIGENLARLRNFADACRAKVLARQIEPADRRVLIEIAQNIGELQSAAKMMREALTFRLGHPKSARGKAADRARHPVAIKIERHESRRPDIGLDIHLHAVDHGAKILAPQAERMNSPGEALQRRIWRPQAGVERVDIAPPSGERLPAGTWSPS